MVLLLLALVAAVWLPDAALACLLLIVPAALVFKRAVPEYWLDPLPLILLGWLLWLPLSLAWSLSPGYALYATSSLLCLPLAWLVGINLSDKRRLNGLLAWLPALLLLIFSFWGAQQGPDTFTNKPQGPFNDPNAFAALLNLFMLPLMALWLGSGLKVLPSWLRHAALGILAGGLYVFFLVSSRGAALALLLALGVLLISLKRQPGLRVKLLLLMLVGLCAFLTASYTTGGLNVAGRIAATVQQGDMPRWLLLQSAWAMISEHPWLGTGLGSFRLLYPQYRLPTETGTAGGWVHNDYLQLWLEAGLPMLLLSLALGAWVVWKIVRVLRSAAPDNSQTLGFLVAVAAVMFQALFNFIFFFAAIAILLGLYLAQASASGAMALDNPAADSTLTTNITRPSPHKRAIKLSAAAYAAIIGFLLIGQAATEKLLFPNTALQQQLAKHKIVYPRYEIAYALSVLNPFNPTPHQAMGLELASLAPRKSGDSPLLRAAMQRFERSQELIPCYMPYVNDALDLVASRPLTPELHELSMRIVKRTLKCDPRHTLTYWYAGLLIENQPGGDPLPWWQTGLNKSLNATERYTLTAAIHSKISPHHKNELRKLATQMAGMLRQQEERPNTRPHNFWRSAAINLQSFLTKSNKPMPHD